MASEEGLEISQICSPGQAEMGRIYPNFPLLFLQSANVLCFTLHPAGANFCLRCALGMSASVLRVSPR